LEASFACQTPTATEAIAYNLSLAKRNEHDSDADQQRATVSRMFSFPSGRPCDQCDEDHAQPWNDRDNSVESLQQIQREKERDRHQKMPLVIFETNWVFRKPVLVVASIARFRMS